MQVNFVILQLNPHSSCILDQKLTLNWLVLLRNDNVFSWVDFSFAFAVFNLRYVEYNVSVQSFMKTKFACLAEG